MRERPYKNSNMTIVIKEADKGSAIVIMHAEFYERKIKEMLHDTTMYEETDHNKDRKTISLIKQLISNTESDLTDKEQDYLTKFESKMSNFYGLPKIHKHRICEYRRGRIP